MCRKQVPMIAGLAVVLLLMLAQPAFADGIIIIDPPVPEVPPYLTVKYHRVTVTIEDQIATTHVDQVFINESRHELEGIYTFPLPEGAAITDFSMWVDGERLSGEILPADEARHIYEDIVRRQRDPALLEYVGRNTFRARIYPIAPRSEKRVEIEYSEVLTADNGLIHYRYPLDTERFSPRPIEDVSVRVEIDSKEAIKAVYSPSHEVDIDRRGDHEVVVGYEEANVKPDTDFDLYYTVSQDDIGLNLLSYKEEGEDGFFLLLLAPQVEVEETEIVAKDILLILDTSGSMRGEKIEQAKGALAFVLDRLHEEDRFNVVSFSTGVRSFSDGLVDAAERERARRWVEGLEAKGGTDIGRAMLEALVQVEEERPTIIIFLTDGLATEGVVETDLLLSQIDGAAPDSVRIFSFGVGDDVNTILLDRMARDHRGASAYVRSGQRIDEEVSAFYAKVSTPLLSDLDLDMGVRIEDTYPYPLPDLFAGTQVVVAGRYRRGGEVTAVLRGTVNGEGRTFEYGGVRLREEGGDAFIPRLWATRKVGYLLNQIRLHGESEELVQEIVDLSVRYGIMTPYTSFLVNEDVQLFSDEGRRTTAEREYSVMATAEPAAPMGKEAVDQAQKQGALERSGTATGATGEAVKVVAGKTFLYREGMWIDTAYDADRMVPSKVGFMSDDYFALIEARPQWGAYLALGDRVLVVLEGKAYQVVAPEAGERIELPTPMPTAAATEAVARRAPTATPAPVVANPGLGTGSRPANRELCAGAAGMVLVALLTAVWFVRRR
ncbi:MAG TPA: VIT domain-containing protein [Anaerolineae bacterium]|nr:VIT domain-containing protein [Anaerolineae bacterium]